MTKADLEKMTIYRFRSSELAWSFANHAEKAMMVLLGDDDGIGSFAWPTPNVSCAPDTKPLLESKDGITWPLRLEGFGLNSLAIFWTGIAYCPGSTRWQLSIPFFGERTGRSGKVAAVFEDGVNGKAAVSPLDIEGKAG